MKCSWGGEICLNLKAWSVGVDNGVGGPGESARGTKEVRLRADFGIDCRVVRGRAGEPVEDVASEPMTGSKERVIEVTRGI